MASSDKLSLYKQVDLDARIEGASPHQLILILFDAAIAALDSAKLAIGDGDMHRKGESITRVTNILGGLRDSLDVGIESDLPHQLDQLYDYMQRQVFEAHLINDCQKLDEIQGLLVTVRSGWNGIASAAV